jgi:hypothetical protein
VHRRERRAQLVRHVGEEAALGVEEHLQAREQVVDREREALELVLRVRLGHALAEILGAHDAAHRVGHLVDRLQGRAREPGAALCGQDQGDRAAAEQRVEQHAQRLGDIGHRARDLHDADYLRDALAAVARVFELDSEGPREHAHPRVADLHALVVLLLRLLAHRFDQLRLWARVARLAAQLAIEREDLDVERAVDEGARRRVAQLERIDINGEDAAEIDVVDALDLLHAGAHLVGHAALEHRAHDEVERAAGEQQRHGEEAGVVSGKLCPQGHREPRLAFR